VSLKDIGHFLYPSHFFHQMKRVLNEQVKVIPTPRNMTSTNWSKNIDSCIESVWEDIFNGDLYDIDDNLDIFKNILNHVPKGMTKASKLYDLLYWKEHKVAHLLDTLHMFKNVSNSLWKHSSSTEKDANASSRDFVVSKTKKYLGEKENINVEDQNMLPCYTRRYCLRMT